MYNPTNPLFKNKATFGHSECQAKGRTHERYVAKVGRPPGASLSFHSRGSWPHSGLVIALKFSRL